MALLSARSVLLPIARKRIHYLSSLCEKLKVILVVTTSRKKDIWDNYIEVKSDRRDMDLKDKIYDRIGQWIEEILERPTKGYQPFTDSDPITLRRYLQPGDVLLIEGNQRVSTAIKYLTQSTWSHAAIYIGDALGPPKSGGEPNSLIEVNLGEGSVAVPLSKYENFNTRICRPIGLTVSDRKKVVQFMVQRIGLEYDTSNILDLARYLFPTPPIPVRWRRRMIALGSGEPTRAICSTLIAQAFQNVRYPILPRIERGEAPDGQTTGYVKKEILHIRHHSLFAPRDFDLSPYFAIIKPTVEGGFDYRTLTWGDEQPGEGSLGEGRPVYDD